jgi:response regulator of citrate/malate metabolism
MEEVFYEPKTGKNVKEKNFKMVKDCLRAEPDITGMMIAEVTGLSKVTVYKYLGMLKRKEC